MARNFTRVSDEYLMVNSTPITAYPFTISTWAKIDADPALDDYCIWQLQDKDVSNNYFRLTADGSASTGEYIFYANDGTIHDADSAFIPTIGEWNHVAGIARTSTDREILVNGGNSGTSAIDISPANLDSIAIGREMDSSPGDSWSGDLAEIGLWDIDLSNPEIASLALGRSPLGIRPQNLVAYWRLVRDEDLDIVGGYNMTAYNTPGIAPHPPVFYSIPPLVIPPAAVAPTGAIMPQLQGPNLGSSLYNGTLL